MEWPTPRCELPIERFRDGIPEPSGVPFPGVDPMLEGVEMPWSRWLPGCGQLERCLGTIRVIAGICQGDDMSTMLNPYLEKGRRGLYCPHWLLLEYLGLQIPR